jgi:hypothetical protein
VPRRRVAVLAGALAAGALALSGAARAQTDEIQVYDAQIAAPGQFNLTWHNNFTPSGRARGAFPGAVIPDHALNGVPEWAYGVTSYFEAGLYLPVYTLTRSGELLFDAVKLRALLVAPDARERTWFYGVNFELSSNAAHWAMSRFSGEIRPIVGVHAGRFTFIVNPILDTDFNGPGRLDFAPAVRAACQLKDRLALALEEYADFGPIEHFNRGSGQSHTLFAVLDYGSSANGFQLGVGRGLTRSSDATVLKLMLIHDL